MDLDRFMEGRDKWRDWTPDDRFAFLVEAIEGLMTHFGCDPNRLTIEIGGPLPTHWGAGWAPDLIRFDPRELEDPYKFEQAFDTAIHEAMHQVIGQSDFSMDRRNEELLAEDVAAFIRGKFEQAAALIDKATEIDVEKAFGDAIKEYCPVPVLQESGTDVFFDPNDAFFNPLTNMIRDQGEVDQPPEDAHDDDVDPVLSGFIHEAGDQ